ncbi:hypothetical protein PPYR_14314 [Photinus pyralis]|uniref:Probable glycerol kinase n=1 Tax=Photinus pyralis TaxID=7054 RepID=A0A1Y1LGZ5_PHOPY|nr:glycerol kinase [Photinus pyralis]KAB0792355.1 hypothetical protein PPYR_14314 [Photinus pyralis]
MFEIGNLIGALDEGTSSARFILFKAGTSEVVVSHQEELQKVHPREGWVEQDPMEILKVVRSCIAETVKKLKALGGSVKNIIAIGIANQRESTIVWDTASGLPLYNSLVWLDMRTTSTVDYLLETVPNNTKNKDYLKPLCGLPLSPYFSALKLRWLHDNVPSIKKAMQEHTCLFGTVDSWIIWNLTAGKVHATDVTNASRTMLMNLDTLDWDPVLLNFFGLPRHILPTIKSCSEVFGYIADGPLDEVPIAGCLGDQQAALVGQQCLNCGEAKSTYGTGCFLLYNTGSKRVSSAHGLLTTVAYQTGPNTPVTYALEGSVAVAGAALSWLKDGMSVISDVNDVQCVAEQADSTGEGNLYFVPAFSGLYAPYWQKDARGVIVGITEDTQSSHIVKATLEAVCFQTRDILEAMNKDYGTSLRKLRVDGGMTSNTYLMQLQADLTGICVVKPVMAESTALGAAMMAGAAIGVWDFKQNLDMPVEEWKPIIGDDKRDLKYSQWKMAVERAMGWDV